MLTQEQKAELLKDYNDPANKLIDLAEKYRLQKGVITRIAVEQGAEPRRPQAYGKKLKSKYVATVCPKCRKRIDVKGARFCCFCGADVRSPKEKVCEQLEQAMTLIQFLPDNRRDEMRDALLAAIRELRGGRIVET
jgi:hypothetical protein